MTILLNIVIVVATVFLMEAFAYYTHKYIMHGLLWSWHKSHHVHHNNIFEKNDLFGIIFAVPSILFIFVGLRFFTPLYYIGIGISIYGIIYFIFHDMIVHQRIKTPLPRNIPYLKRIIQAHRLHHAVEEKEGGVSFGFLYAHPIKSLKEELQNFNNG